MGWRYFANPPLYKPEQWEKVQDQNDAHGNTEDLSLWMCLPAGFPGGWARHRGSSRPANDLVLLYNGANFLNGYSWRVMPTEGRPHHPGYILEDQT